MRSFYLQFCVFVFENGLFPGTYPLIYGNTRSFYMQIHYMGAYFWSPYLLHITRSTCITKEYHNIVQKVQFCLLK